MEPEVATPQAKTAPAPGGAAAKAAGELKHAVEMFLRRSQAFASQQVIRYKHAGAWKPLTWGDWERDAREIAGGLRSVGVKSGDRVCMLAATRYEWVASDVGILMAGAATVPIYQSNLAEQCRYIVDDSGAKVVIVDEPLQLEKIVSVFGELGRVAKVVYIDEHVKLERPDAKGRLEIKVGDVVPAGHAIADKLISFEQLKTLGREWIAANAGALERSWDAIEPSSIFTIVYTSGTTGPPKGVVLAHSNIVWEAKSLAPVMPVTDQDEQLLFLPLAHIFAKILAWGAIANGGRIAFAENMTTVAANMKEVHPTWLGAVPRVYEKVFAKVKDKLASEPPTKQKLIRWALGVGNRMATAKQHRRSPGLLLSAQYAIADRLVLAKLRDIFGGRVRFLVSGGAPLAPEIADFFHGIGIIVLEGYGLTETTAGSCLNRLDQYKFGTVGPPVPGLELKVAGDGEILIRGPSVMKGYYNKPDDTRAVIDADGWFHTGDIGVIENGMVRITDRKKDIIVTAGGKNIAPQNIENLVKLQSPLISHVVVHGDRRPYCVALVTLAEDMLAPWAKQHGVSGAYAELVRSPAVQAEVKRIFERANEQLAQFEKVKKFHVLPRDLSQDEGELTPKMNFKRKFVSDRYKAELDALYEGA